MACNFIIIPGRFRPASIWLSLCALSLTALSGCSPYTYSSSTQLFNAATASVSSSFQTTVSASTDEQQQYQKLKFLQFKPQILPGPGCTINSNVACQLIKKPDANTASTASPVSGIADSVINTKISNLLDVLHSYSNALTALTNAQDRADFDKAGADLGNAVGSLSAGLAAASTAGVAAPAIGGLAAASTNFVLWIVGEDLDYQRLQKLELAVDKADPLIAQVCDALATALANQKTARFMLLEETLSLQLYNLNQLLTDKKSADYATALDTSIVATQKLQAVKDSDPVAAITALKNAHALLKKSIDEKDDESLSNLSVSLQTFTTQANNLAAAAVQAK